MSRPSIKRSPEVNCFLCDRHVPAHTTTLVDLVEGDHPVTTGRVCQHCQGELIKLGTRTFELWGRACQVRLHKIAVGP